MEPGLSLPSVWGCVLCKSQKKARPQREASSLSVSSFLKNGLPPPHLKLSLGEVLVSPHFKEGEELIKKHLEDREDDNQSFKSKTALLVDEV